MDAPERYEQILAFLGSQLPAPVDQQADGDDPEASIQFIGGDPAEVVVVLTQASVVVFEFAGVWETPFSFVAKPRRVGALKWRRLPETALWSALSALIKGAREARLAKFQVCRYCERNTPPEWLDFTHGVGMCQSCADQHSGAIH